MTASDEIPPQISDLGNLIEEFRPSKGNIVAGMMLGTALFAGGAGFVSAAIREAALAGLAVTASERFRVVVA